MTRRLATAGLLVMLTGCGVPEAWGEGTVVGTTSKGEVSLSGGWIGTEDKWSTSSSQPYIMGGKLPQIRHESVPKPKPASPDPINYRIWVDLENWMRPGNTGTLEGQFDGDIGGAGVGDSLYKGGTVTINHIEFTGDGTSPIVVHAHLGGTLQGRGRSLEVDIDVEYPTYCGGRPTSGQTICRTDVLKGDIKQGDLTEPLLNSDCPPELVSKVVGDRQWSIKGSSVQWSGGLRFPCVGSGPVCGIGQDVEVNGCTWRVDSWVGQGRVHSHGAQYLDDLLFVMAIPNDSCAAVNTCSSLFQLTK